MGENRKEEGRISQRWTWKRIRRFGSILSTVNLQIHTASTLFFHQPWYRDSLFGFVNVFDEMGDVTPTCPSTVHVMTVSGFHRETVYSTIYAWSNSSLIRHGEQYLHSNH